MTTTEDQPGEDGPATTGGPATGGPAFELPEPEERGSLTVSSDVIRKVAQEITDRTPGTLRIPHRGGVGCNATIERTTSTVDIALDVALRYPAPIREITERVRRRVIEEVQRVTGYQVRAVTFTVSALLRETQPRVK